MDNVLKLKKECIKNKINGKIAKESGSKARRLTVENPSKDPGNGSDLDKQILELENLINKLQVEIIEMSKSSDDIVKACTEKDISFPEDDIQVLAAENSDFNSTSSIAHQYNKDNSSSGRTTLDNSNLKQTSYGNSVMQQDLVENLTNQSKHFADQVKNLLYPNSDYQNTTNIFDNIRREFSNLWIDHEKSSSNDRNDNTG